MRQTIYISNYNLQPLFIFIVTVIFIIITLLIMIITTFISGSNSSNSAIISIIDIILIFSSIKKISVLLTLSTSIFELFRCLLLFYINILHHFFIFLRDRNGNKITSFLPQFSILMNFHLYTS